MPFTLKTFLVQLCSNLKINVISLKYLCLYYGNDRPGNHNPEVEYFGLSLKITTGASLINGIELMTPNAMYLSTVIFETNTNH